MAGMGIDAALLRRLQRGEYAVDALAVAEAMLASGVFVALQSGDLDAALVQKRQPFARRRLA
jgi:hypothetical protein